MAYTTDEQIDALMREWNRGTTDTVQRALILTFIKQSERERWSGRNWWFKKDVVSLSFVQAKTQYDFPATVADVEAVFDANGLLMTKLSQRTYDRVYRGTTVVGTPRNWCVDQIIQATGVIRVRVAPLPSANSTGAARVEVRSNADSLTDASSSASAFPLEARGLIDNDCLAKMAMHSGSVEKTAYYQARADREAEELIQEDIRRQVAA